MKKAIAVIGIVLLLLALLPISRVPVVAGASNVGYKYKYVFPFVYMKPMWGTDWYGSGIIVFSPSSNAIILVDTNFNGPDSSDKVVHLSAGERVYIGDFPDVSNYKTIQWNKNPLVIYSNVPLYIQGFYETADFGDYDDAYIHFGTPIPGTKLIGPLVQRLYITAYSSPADVYVNGNYVGHVTPGEVIMENFSTAETVIVTSTKPVVAMAVSINPKVRSKTYAFPLMPPMSGKFLIPESNAQYAYEMNAQEVSERYLILDSAGNIIDNESLPSTPQVLSLHNSEVFVFRTFYYKDLWDDDAPRYAMSATAIKPAMESTLFGGIGKVTVHTVNHEVVFYATSDVKVYEDYNGDGTIDDVKTLPAGRIYEFSDRKDNTSMIIYVVGNISGEYLAIGGWTGQLEGATETGTTPIQELGVSMEVHPPKPSLVAYYSFDHCDARDDSGNGHDGTIYGNPKCVAGVLGKAFEFDGENDYIWLGRSEDLSPSHITVALWAKFTSNLSYDYEAPRLIRNRAFGYGMLANNTSIFFTVYDNDDPESPILASTSINKYLDRKWHFIVGTFDGEYVRLYIDGKLMNKTLGHGTGEIYYEGNAVAIGRDGDYPGGYFPGLIDEVRIYNRALSEEEIKALYEQGVGGSGGTSTTTTTNTQTSTPTRTQTATNTQTSTPTKTQTATITQTPSPTNTQNPTQTPSQTNTQTSTLAPIARTQIDTASQIISKIPSSIDVGDAKTMLDEAQKAYDNGDYELAKKFAETAQALAVKSYYDKLKADVQVKESKGYDVGKATKLLQQAYDAYNRKDYTKALELLASADLALQTVAPVKKPNYALYGALALVLFGAVLILTKSQKSKKEKLTAEFTSLINSGDNIVQKDQFGALEYYSKAFQIAKQLKDSKLIAEAQEKLNTVRGTVIAEINSLIAKGNDALAKSDYDKALAYYRQALSLAEKLNDKEKIREAKSKMDSVNKVRKIRELLSEGDVLMEGEKYSQALSRYEEALNLAKVVEDSYLVELLKGRISKANEMVEKLSTEVSSLVSQAGKELMEENYESAIEKLSQALVLAEKIGGTVSIEDIKRKLEEAKKRKKLRDRLREAKSTKDYGKALTLYGDALRLAQELNDERMIAQIKAEIEEVKKAQILETLKNGITLILPKEVPYGREVTLSINVENRLDENIENLTIDLSELSPYFTLSEEKVAFPPIRPGRKLGKDIIIKPQFKGDFDFNVKISSNFGETVKTLKVKVSDYYAPAQFTPKPLTPKAAPGELEAFYEDFKYVGEGGFARVFKARRKKDGRVVAVKIPKTLDPATGKAFVREITNWLHLKHPNIVELYDVNVIPIPYLEMEYCEGSLAKLGKPMDVEQASHIVFNIAEGLKYAHSKGIIHRDLKPSNVLLKAGIPKISDWGLSKTIKESRSASMTIFTPHYAAPEQISRSKFGHTDGRTDIWQLGILFYELVTGKLPFEGRDLGEITFAIINENPVPPGEINPEAKIVEPIIMKMLAKRKEKRYQSVEELQKDLAKVLNMTYVEGLKKSRDLKRTVFYIGDLALINLKTGNLSEALKYLLELREYAGKYQKDLDWLIEQVKLAMDENVKLGEEAVMKADVIIHQIKMGR